MPREAAGAGWVYTQDQFAVTIPAGTGQVSSILSQPRPFAERIIAVSAIVKVLATGAAASRVLNIRKGSATGAVVATTTYVLADGTPVGTVKALVVTAANADFLDADNLTIEWPTAGAVAFTAGELIITITTRKRLQQQS